MRHHGVISYHIWILRIHVTTLTMVKDKFKFQIRTVSANQKEANWYKRWGIRKRWKVDVRRTVRLSSRHQRICLQVLL